MKYYQDITLLPDAEVSLGLIWEKVYQQIHLLLVEHKCAEGGSELGLSFPSYGDKAFPLGNQLRLFANTQKQLEVVNVSQWLQRFTDYVHIKSIKLVPSEVAEYVCFSRYNPKSQQRRLKLLEGRVAHLAVKHGVDEQTIRAQLLTAIELRPDGSTPPYINVQSLSTPLAGQQRHKFRLFIQREKAVAAPDKSNLFTCYGLTSKVPSNAAPVPWF